MRALALAGLSIAVAGCDRYWVCEADDPGRTGELPGRLSETGLFADTAARALAPEVVPYAPRFALWSDGAEKQRWIALPPGAQIDTANMDEWSFPSGTKLWKQFSVDGVEVETRLLEKRGPADDDWIALAYVWQPDGLDAVAAPLGGIDVAGTDHDVPASGECFACHGGRRSFALGFSAIQLAAPARPGEIDLAELVAQGRLTAPAATAPVVPGDATQVAALGYLHANCSHCHNQARPEHRGARCFDPKKRYDFTLAVGSLASVEDTPTYRTVVGKAIEPGDPDGSEVVSLMGQRGFLDQMPPLATEKVDTTAVALIRAWIEEMR